MTVRIICLMIVAFVLGQLTILENHSTYCGSEYDAIQDR